MNQISQQVLEEMPKKPLNPYMIFRREMYPQIQKTKQFSTMTEISQTIAEIWSEMTELERQVYKDKSYEAHTIYLQQYNDWLTKYNLNQKEVKTCLIALKQQKQNSLVNKKKIVQNIDTKKNNNFSNQKGVQDVDNEEKQIQYLKQQIVQQKQQHQQQSLQQQLEQIENTK